MFGGEQSESQVGEKLGQIRVGGKKIGSRVIRTWRLMGPKGKIGCV